MRSGCAESRYFTMNKPTTFAFDLETAGQPLDKLTPPQFKIDSRLKDPAKIEAAQAEKLAEWQSSLALNAPTATILAAGICVDGRCTTTDGDEDSVISWCWSVIDDTPYPTVIGHFLRGFDIPMLARRSFILGIKVPKGIMHGRFINSRFICTMEAWAMGTRDTISLDNLAKALGVGSKTGSGGDFAALYKTDKKAALAYLETDLRLTWACADRMGLT